MAEPGSKPSRSFLQPRQGMKCHFLGPIYCQGLSSPWSGTLTSVNRRKESKSGIRNGSRPQGSPQMKTRLSCEQGSLHRPSAPHSRCQNTQNEHVHKGHTYTHKHTCIHAGTCTQKQAHTKNYLWLDDLLFFVFCCCFFV